MAITYDECIALLEKLKEDYEEQHADFRRLRDLWHGRYWENTNNRNRPSVSSIFRDLTQRASDVGPDIKLTYNLLRDVCVKYQSYFAPLPMIQMYVDPPSSAKRRANANLKERFLYGTWAENRMNQVMSDQGFYLPLMGNVFLGAYPDMQNNVVRAIIRSPEFAFPVPSYDYGKQDGVIFCFKARLSAIRRVYPDFNPKYRTPRAGLSRRRVADPELEVVEYSDTNCFYRWCESEYLQGVEHDFGFDLFEHIKFINIPGEAFGEGAVAQSANLVEMGNAYLSLMMQSAIENVFPVMVLEDAMKAPEVIQRGAGAVIPVNAGGKVYYLQPPAGNLLAQSDWAQRIEQMIKTNTSMPDVNFGVAENSIITGKAINELQGAGTGNIVDMVRGVSIGAGLSSWNEKAIHISRQMFADEPIRLYGQLAGSIAELNPKRFALNIKGSELTGSTRNEVVFMPHLDMHTKVVLGLQLAGGGIVSRNWQRNQIGIPDSEAMDEEIVSETIQDAALQLLVQQITAPEDQLEVEAQTQKVIQGVGVRAGAPAAPPALRAGAAGAPDQFGAAPGGGQMLSPALEQPPGAPPPADRPQITATAGEPQGSLSLPTVMQAFETLEVSGRVFLIGEIVVTGTATDTVEVAITNPEDRQAVTSVAFPVSVKVVPGEPNEEYIEVTPGASAASGGAPPSPEALFGAE